MPHFGCEKFNKRHSAYLSKYGIFILFFFRLKVNLNIIIVLSFVPGFLPIYFKMIFDFTVFDFGVFQMKLSSCTQQYT